MQKVKKTFARIWSWKFQSEKPGKDLCWVVKISGHMKPGYQNFQLNFQIPFAPVPRINNGSLYIKLYVKDWVRTKFWGFLK